MKVQIILINLISLWGDLFTDAGLYRSSSTAYLQYFLLKHFSVVSINGVLYYQFWIALLLITKMARDEESGILWLSDN